MNDVNNVPDSEFLKYRQLTLYQKIICIMGEIQQVNKGDKKVNGQYTFVSHDEVSRVFQPILVKYGVIVVPAVKEYVQNGNRTETLVNVTFVNADNAEERFSVNHVGYGIDGGDKGPGKAMSYAVKYAYLKTFCVPSADEDSDHNASARHITSDPHVRAEKSSKNEDSLATRSEIEMLKEVLNSIPAEKKEAVLKFLQDNGQSLESMKVSMFKSIYKRLKNG